MTDSGFSQLPPGPRIFDPAPAQTRPEQTVKIESARGELGNLRRPVRVEGDVVRVTPDGIATIRTGQGEIDVRLRGRLALQEGQKIDIDIPAGAPPRQAVLRPVPETPALPQSPTLPSPLPQPAPGPAETPSAPASTSAPRPLPAATTKTIPPEIRILLDELTQASQSLEAPFLPAPLPLEAIIRLIPLAALPSPAELAPLPVAAAVALPGQAAIRLNPVAEFSPPDGYRPIVLSAPVFEPVPPAALPVLPFLSAAGTETPFPQDLKNAPPLLRTALEAFLPVISFSSAGTESFFPALPERAVRIIATHLAPPAAFLPRIPVLPFSGALIAGQRNAASPTSAPVTIPPAQFDARIIAIQPGESIRLVLPDGTQPTRSPRAEILSDSPIRIQPSPVSVTAQVIAVTKDNFPVLNLAPTEQSKENLLFLLQFPASNLPPGTQLDFMPRQIMLPAIPSTPVNMAAPTPAFTLLSGWTWPVFDEIDDLLNPALAAATAQSTANPLANILPNPGNPAQMAPAILFLIAAARSGDLSSWLGEKAISALRREGGRGTDLLSKLTRDVSGLSKMMSEPVGQDWRGMAIPLYWHGDIQKINLFYRHQDNPHEDDPGQTGERSTRFIFDLHLSRIGDLQLDGLMKSKRLDLILRSHTAFSQAMQIEMRRIYLEILDTGNLIGDLGFQSRGDHWVRVETRQTGLQTSA